MIGRHMFIQFDNKDTEDTIANKVHETISRLLSGKSKRRKIIHSGFKACTRYKLNRAKLAKLLLSIDMKYEPIIRKVSNMFKPSVKSHINDEIDKMLVLL